MRTPLRSKYGDLEAQILACPRERQRNLIGVAVRLAIPRARLSLQIVSRLLAAADAGAPLDANLLDLLRRLHKQWEDHHRDTIAAVDPSDGQIATSREALQRTRALAALVAAVAQPDRKQVADVVFDALASSLDGDAAVRRIAIATQAPGRVDADDEQ